VLLYEANVNVYASSGVADGRGSYRYVIYVKPDDYERAVAALEAFKSPGLWNTQMTEPYTLLKRINMNISEAEAKLDDYSGSAFVD